MFLKCFTYVPRLFSFLVFARLQNYISIRKWWFIFHDILKIRIAYHRRRAGYFEGNKMNFSPHDWIIYKSISVMQQVLLKVPLFGTKWKYKILKIRDNHKYGFDNFFDNHEFIAQLFNKELDLSKINICFHTAI